MITTALASAMATMAIRKVLIILICNTHTDNAFTAYLSIPVPRYAVTFYDLSFGAP